MPGIEGVDTRALTQQLRDQRRDARPHHDRVARPALATRRSSSACARTPGLEGRDLVREVTSPDAFTWDEGSWQHAQERASDGPPPARQARRRLRLRHQAQHPAPARRRRLPRHGGAGDDAGGRGAGAAPDGVFLSNGPGDPAAVDLRGRGVPRASSTRGCRCSASASATRSSGWRSAARTYKLKFGHHGANQPVMDLATRKVEITSQNHGFAVDVESLRGQGRADARQPQRRHRRGHAARPTGRPSACSTTPRPRRGRTTPPTCSIASWRSSSGSAE